MPWFRLEDSFYDNPKVRRAGNAAVGLWVRCATYSARQLTDGRIPAYVVREMGKPTEIAAATRSGLWLPDDEEYVMPDYLEYNPSASHIKQRRKRDAERKREEREKAGRDPVTGRFIGDPFQ